MIVPPTTGGDFVTNLINDVIVIGLASISSYLISVSVVKHSSKSILSAINLEDVFNSIKKLFTNISSDEQIKQSAAKFLSNIITSALENEEISAKIRIFIVSALNNEDLRNDLKDFLVVLLNDKKLHEEVKKSMADIISQYPVLEKFLIGGKNARKETKAE